jgi:rubrerythrin
MSSEKQTDRDKLLETVKNALMIEIHGLRFYQVAAERCSSPSAREIFSDLAQDEIRHRSELEKQFRSILDEGRWSPPSSEPPKDLRFSDPVIDKSLKKNIEGAWFDSAALQIGVLLERRALDHYREQEKTAENPELKAVFQWLIGWEQGHLNRLMALERAMRDEIWNEAGFWPLD